MSDPLLAPGLTASLAGNAPKLASLEERTRATARDFEGLFLNSMLQQMFQNVGNGPFGGGHAGAVWRSFLTDEYAKSIAKNGGVGIADHVYKSLMALQEAKPAAQTAAAP
jgi:Rod binding domain-containing protein